MCNTVLVSGQIEHTLRGSWTPAGAAAAGLSRHAVRWLANRIGLPDTVTPTVPVSLLNAPSSALPATAHTDLVDAVGEEFMLTSAAERLGRSGGMAYLDLLRRRTGEDVAVPDAVVLPGSPEQVQRVLDLCVRHDIAVVPFGGGTSVVGGVEALRGDKTAVIALDLCRLDRVVSLDPVSRIAVLQAGMRAVDAERLLAGHGFTLGHFPQSFERATIGGFAATRSSGQASSGYGRFDDMVQAVRVATPAGEWRLGAAPASAAGPDLRQLAIGSEGALGVITEVAVRVRPAPRHTRYEAVVIDGWQAGVEAVRALAQQRALADVTRLSDVEETAAQLALSGHIPHRLVRALLRSKGIQHPCLLVLGWETETRRELTQRRAAALRALRGRRWLRLGQRPGKAWRESRFAAPRQRDALMDFGVCVETLETATNWSGLLELRSAVRTALIRSLQTGVQPPLIMCHLSHAYETGASLYFTVLAARDEKDPVGQWQKAKAAACEAITGRGTITHHHAVGTDHLPWLDREIGQVGTAVLAAVKRAVDPTGILNPGKLIRPAQ